MWLSRRNSNPRLQKSFSKNFSFKDIEFLCSDNSNNHKPPATAKPSVFHRVFRATAVLRAFGTPPRLLAPSLESESKPASSPSLSNEQHPDQSEPSISIPGAEDRIVVYLTSLRVVRTTFEDCRTVQSILRGFRVTIDERDLSMDSSFMDELQRILNIWEKSKLTLPRVFIGGKYIGGAEEIRQLNETGDLKKMVAALPTADAAVCEECGGYRFILCSECSGSHKCYTEKSDGFRFCTACNENGLIRCPSCSCGPL